MNPSPGETGHDELRERLGAHLLGGLDVDERAEVEAHLATCAACRDEVRELAPLVGPLGMVDVNAPDDAVRAEPTAAGFAAIADRIRDERAAGPAAADAVPSARDGRSADDPAEPAPPATVLPIGATRRRTPSTAGPTAPTTGSASARRSPGAMAAAAALVALVGLGAGFGLGLRAGTEPLEPVAVQALEPGVDATAGTIDHTWGVEVVLTASGFTPGEAFEVAVLDEQGRAVDAGAFVGTGDTEMECRLNSSLLREDATGFVVTDERGDEVLRSRFA